jgi:predicted transglutaminase-like cysteine proteinase
MSIALGFLFEEVYPVYHIWAFRQNFHGDGREFMERWRQLIFSGWSFSSTSIAVVQR